MQEYEHYRIRYEINRNKINLLYYELEGVKGIDYTKEKHNAYNHDAHIERYYNISDQIAEKEKENDFIKECLKGLEYIKDNIKDKEIKAKVTKCFFNVFD